MLIVIKNPPNNIGGSYVNIEIESGVYQPSDINYYFNGLFSSSSNGLQFLKCNYNYLSKKVVFRAYSFWLDGYLTQIVNDIPVLGGGPFDETIIDPMDPTALIPNPFYEPTCKFILFFTTPKGPARPIYRSLGWLLGFTYCEYEISMDNCYRYNGVSYYNFYNYFGATLPPNYTNDLYLQQYFGLDTSFFNVYGYIQGEHIFIDRSIIPNTGIYVFLDIDDYNKNYNPTSTSALSENFDSTFSATTFSKINISTTNTTIDNNPITGVNYYRLSQVDYSGQRESFNIISIELTDDMKKCSDIFYDLMGREIDITTAPTGIYLQKCNKGYKKIIKQ
jgi:hypothetical protein